MKVNKCKGESEQIGRKVKKIKVKVNKGNGESEEIEGKVNKGKGKGESKQTRERFNPPIILSRTF